MKLCLQPLNVLFLIIAVSCGPADPAKPAELTAVTATTPAATGPLASDTVQLITAIKNEFERINKAGLTAKVFLWKTDSTCEAPYMEGKITYYYEEGVLVKIHDDGSEDHGVWKEDYYFKDGTLFFIYQDNTYGGAGDPTANTYQSRYYFFEEQLIKKTESANYTLDAAAIQHLVKKADKLYNAADAATISRILTCD